MNYLITLFFTLLFINSTIAMDLSDKKSIPVNSNHQSIINHLLQKGKSSTQNSKESLLESLLKRTEKVETDTLANSSYTLSYFTRLLSSSRDWLLKKATHQAFKAGQFEVLKQTVLFNARNFDTTKINKAIILFLNKLVSQALSKIDKNETDRIFFEKVFSDFPLHQILDTLTQTINAIEYDLIAELIITWIDKFDTKIADKIYASVMCEWDANKDYIMLLKDNVIEISKEINYNNVLKLLSDMSALKEFLITAGFKTDFDFTILTQANTNPEAQILIAQEVNNLIAQLNPEIINNLQTKLIELLGLNEKSVSTIKEHLNFLPGFIMVKIKPQVIECLGLLSQLFAHISSDEDAVLSLRKIAQLNMAKIAKIVQECDIKLYQELLKIDVEILRQYCIEKYKEDVHYFDGQKFVFINSQIVKNVQQFIRFFQTPAVPQELKIKLIKCFVYWPVINMQLVKTIIGSTKDKELISFTVESIKNLTKLLFDEVFQKGDIKVIQYYIQRLDIGVTDVNKNTLLHAAVIANNIDLVKFLLTNNYKELIDARNSDNKTPIDCAFELMSTGKPEIFNLFKELAADSEGHLNSGEPLEEKEEMTDVNGCIIH